MGALGAFPATLLLFVEIHPFSVFSRPGEICQRGRGFWGGERAGKDPRTREGPGSLQNSTGEIQGRRCAECPRGVSGMFF